MHPELRHHPAILLRDLVGFSFFNIFLIFPLFHNIPTEVSRRFFYKSCSIYPYTGDLTMKTGFILFGIMLFAAMSFAVIETHPPTMYKKYVSAYCQYYTHSTFISPYHGMAEAVNAYNGSKNGAMSAIGDELDSVFFGEIASEYCHPPPYDLAAFNAAYSGSFRSLMNQATALYLRSAIDYKLANPGFPFGNVLSEYQSFQTEYSECYYHYTQEVHLSCP
jgi:hypothetical protein